MLYREMIRDGIERGVRRFEFGDGHLHFKARWGAAVDDCRQTFAVVPNRLLGRAASLTRKMTRLITTTADREHDVTGLVRS